MELLNVLDENVDSNSYLQTVTVKELYNIFNKSEIQDLEINNYFFIGVRGNYEGKENYTLSFKFNYHNYFLEFYLSYDQLEFYISLAGIIQEKCTLEDFTDDEDEMIKTFLNYLKKDLIKLDII